MVQIKNSRNAETFPKWGEKSTGISQTVPDQAMSIKEILDRYTRGLPVSGVRVPLYHEEEDYDTDLPDLSRMDRADRAMAMQEYKQELESLTISIKKQQEQHEKAKKQRKPEQTGEDEAGAATDEPV